MMNVQCPLLDAYPLASVALDICPFPNYFNNHYFSNILTPNSSSYLNYKYEAIQSSLKPKQLQDFTRSLRTTFGRERKVSYGGVGVVALSLVIVFDTVARQVKEEYVSDHDLVPGVFIKNPRGYYPPSVYTISKYLRLVPHIANNPSRMREETEVSQEEPKLPSYQKESRRYVHLKDDYAKLKMEEVVWICTSKQKFNSNI